MWDLPCSRGVGKGGGLGGTAVKRPVLPPGRHRCRPRTLSQALFGDQRQKSAKGSLARGSRHASSVGGHAAGPPKPKSGCRKPSGPCLSVLPACLGCLATSLHLCCTRPHGSDAAPSTPNASVKSPEGSHWPNLGQRPSPDGLCSVQGRGCAVWQVTGDPCPHLCPQHTSSHRRVAKTPSKLGYPGTPASGSPPPGLSSCRESWATTAPV